MINQDILNFFSKLSEDENLRKQFLDKPLEERYSLALKNSKHHFSKEEFTEAMAELYKYLTNEEKTNQKLEENNLEDISGGVDISMVDIVNARDLPKDFSAFQGANTDDKLSILDAIDDVLNGGALLVSSVHGFVKKFKQGNKLEKLKQLQKKREKMELLVEQAKLSNTDKMNFSNK